MRNRENFHYISFPEQVYSLWFGSSDDEVSYLAKCPQYESNIVKFTYSSFTQPKQVIEYNMQDRSRRIIKEEKVQGDKYEKDQYRSERIYAVSHDGTSVPISVVYRKDLVNANEREASPTLLHAYGAYGGCINPAFSKTRLSLLDRGFVFAIAHVRGSGMLGNAWYEDGKLEKKSNTFKDFCAAAEHLINERYTDSSKLAIYGRSAGGLLIGASINMRPDLFKAALMEVPFLDVINTMFNSSIPWTAFEYEEWGNPEDKKIYEAMKQYCPYTNLDEDKLAQNLYPHLFILGGMNDPRVAYFEPLKFVAKIRHLQTKNKTDVPIEKERMTLLKIENYGHVGNSGQSSFLEELAMEYAFLVHTLGAPEKPLDAKRFKLKSSKSQMSLLSNRLKTWVLKENVQEDKISKSKLLKWVSKIW